jgi:hypothetical protein
MHFLFQFSIDMIKLLPVMLFLTLCKCHYLWCHCLVNWANATICHDYGSMFCWWVIYFAYLKLLNDLVMLSVLCDCWWVIRLLVTLFLVVCHPPISSGLVWLCWWFVRALFHSYKQIYWFVRCELLICVKWDANLTILCYLKPTLLYYIKSIAGICWDWQGYPSDSDYMW